MENYTLPDLLTVVLNGVANRAGEQRRLPQNPAILHRAFYDLREKYAGVFPQLYDLHFITAGAFPYSPDLTEVLDILQFSGSISRDNPSYEQFTIKQYGDSEDWMAKSFAQVTGGDDAVRRSLDSIVEDLSTAFR